MNQEALTALTRARTKLILSQPFFGALALQLQLEEDSSIDTLAVSPKRVRYNPEFVLGLSEPLRISAMAHEVMHCVLGHSRRVGERDRRKWNVAGDYVINQILEDSKFEIGPGWLLNPGFKGMSTDHIYSLLPDSDDPDNKDDPLDDVESDPDPAAEQDWKIAAGQAARAAKMAALSWIMVSLPPPTSGCAARDLAR